MRFPWFTSTPAVAPARSGSGLTSTYAADRAEALAAHRKAAADALEKRTREINAELDRAKQLSAQTIAKAEADVEATRKRMGEAILEEFYGATGELARAHLTEPTRAVAQKLRDAFMRFRERSLVELGVPQGTEYTGLAFASLVVAEAPASVTAFAGSDVTGDFLGMRNRGLTDPFQWEEELDLLTRRIVARVTMYAAFGHEVTDYHRDYFHALKWSPTANDRHHAVIAVDAVQAARKQAAFVANHVAPPVVRRPLSNYPGPEYTAVFGAQGHATELTE